MKRFYLLCLVLAVLAGVVYGVWFFFFRNEDETRIRKMFAEALEYVSCRQEKSVVVNAGDMRGLEKMMSDPFTIGYGSRFRGESARRELLQKFMAGRRFLKYLECSVYDLVITFPEKDQAEAVFTAAVSFSKEEEMSLFAGKAVLKKSPEDGWLFQSATLTELEQ